MSKFAAFAALATLALGGAAVASTVQVSDAQYVATARCKGLMASSALGKPDAASIDAALKSESAGRMPAVEQQADDARSSAARQAGHAGPQEKAALAAERDGTCQSLAHAGDQGAMSAVSRPVTTN